MQAAISLSDEPGRGMPPQNIAALRSFLEVKRTPGLPEECSSLPGRIRRELLRFTKSARHIRFMQPDGKPDERWLVHYDKTWGEAKRLAEKESEAASLAKTAANPPSIEALLHAANRAPSPYAAVDLYSGAARNVALNVAGLSGRFGQAVSAYNAVSDAVLDQFWSQLREADHDAAVEACSDLRNDAALMVLQILVSDQEFEGKGMYMTLARARWNVWAKGYALECDVTCSSSYTELFVYCKGERPG